VLVSDADDDADGDAGGDTVVPSTGAFPCDVDPPSIMAFI
tara:strand:+ start:3172 stop:3291 length:120 start_codon:yes stop_codon:yes gene_type:complete